MSDVDKPGGGLIGEVNRSLFTLFRHLFPGVYILGAAYVAHPSWFASLDTKSWEHLTVLGVVALTAGNIWFSFNRYGVHQAIDYIVYLANSAGPAPTSSRSKYLDDLGRYVAKSLNARAIPPLARQHIAFRASAVLLLYTVAEVGLLFAAWHEPDTLFSAHSCMVVMASLLVLTVGVWQNVITRRIDHHVISYQ